MSIFARLDRKESISLTAHAKRGMPSNVISSLIGRFFSTISNLLTSKSSLSLHTMSSTACNSSTEKSQSNMSIDASGNRSLLVQAHCNRGIPST
mmetsp:Transcript_3681/g.5043  ORF Transcript_3681/g.5043 Transcript_3681/m.5043 type:complete len:94 (-) Transcript_3681:601-882(-)